MNLSIRKQLLDFTVNDIPNIIHSIDELRLQLVRLESRNRQQKEGKIPSIRKYYNNSTSRVNDLSSMRYKIDERGQRYYWVKKTAVITKEFPIKMKIKRPTHRGRRKKDTSIIGNLKRIQTTFNQLIPSASDIPQQFSNLIVLLHDIHQQLQLYEDIVQFNISEEFREFKHPFKKKKQ